MSGAKTAAEKAARTTQEDIPICPGCSEANGTDGWAIVRHDPPLCKTSAEQAALAPFKPPKEEP